MTLQEKVEKIIAAKDTDGMYDAVQKLTDNQKDIAIVSLIKMMGGGDADGAGYPNVSEGRFFLIHFGYADGNRVEARCDHFTQDRSRYEENAQKQRFPLNAIADKVDDSVKCRRFPHSCVEIITPYHHPIFWYCNSLLPVTVYTPLPQRPVPKNRGPAKKVNSNVREATYIT